MELKLGADLNEVGFHISGICFNIREGRGGCKW